MHLGFVQLASILLPACICFMLTSARARGVKYMYALGKYYPFVVPGIILYMYIIVLYMYIFYAQPVYTPTVSTLHYGHEYI